MEALDVRAYLDRCRTAGDSGKREHWAREYRQHGSTATLDAAQALWLHMRAVRPEWPSEDERQADLAHHVALKRAIDRAERAFLAAR
jgi:hypothetical protein